MEPAITEAIHQTDRETGANAVMIQSFQHKESQRRKKDLTSIINMISSVVSNPSEDSHSAFFTCFRNCKSPTRTIRKVDIVKGLSSKSLFVE